MSTSFSWQNFDRMSRVLESLGYMVAVFGPLIGVAILIFGSSVMRLMALVIIIASVLIALYHISFALLMDAVRSQLKRSDDDDKTAP